MGGIRTAGDLVARMEMSHGMRLSDAKQYVADRIGCSTRDLSDPIVMHDIRRDLGLGRIPVQELTYPGEPGAMEAKFRIAELLGKPINSVEKFKRHARI